MNDWCNPDSKVYGAIMGPTWGQQVPGGPHVGPMNIAIWEVMNKIWTVTIMDELIILTWVNQCFTKPT